jgi:signal transduction histidine kinase
MHTILIIEDEEPLRQTLAERLTLEGFHVQTAANGKVGVRQVQADPPDLILCDIVMPEMDGYSVLLALQSDARTAAIPFIFLTAKADPPQVRAGMDLGADDYLCKPVAKAELLAAIRGRLCKRGQQQERLAQEVKAAHLEVVRKLPCELLAPLTSLFGASQILESADPVKPVANVRELGQSMRLAAERLQRMIHRFMLYSELEVASHRPQAQAQLRGTGHLPATAWVAAQAEHLAAQAARSEDLHLDLAEVEVVMAAFHFSELVAQLVDNAFQFSPLGSAVQIHLGLLAHGECELSVRDQGSGMTPEQIRQVAAFRQFDRAAWAQPGTKLGLALVGRIVDLYGGSLVFDSQPGKGTQATVRLPNARPGTPGEPTPDPQWRRRVSWRLGLR